MEFVVLESNQLSVDERVLDVFVSEQFHDVKDVFGLGVFGGGFPVSEGVEVDFQDSGVSKLVGDSFSLGSEGLQRTNSSKG